MKPLLIPPPLASEFATVVAVWESNGTTRRVDALLLCWVKYEKQLRRLFSFLVFQHPQIDGQTAEEVVAALAENNRVYPRHFEKGIKELKVTPVPELMGEAYAALKADIERINSYRNKLMHGQITGKKITSPEIEKDVRILIRWISALADGARAEFGYDGIGRNTYRAAKANANIAVGEFPFKTATEFKQWLGTLAK